MELALQVVGLKMTGKIEDAKNVAMRIVGNTGNEGGNQHSSNGAMQMSSTSLRDLRSLLLVRAGENEDFEKLIVDFLAILKTPIDHPSSKVVSVATALSYTTPGGQTLLHLAAFMGFSSLVTILVGLGIDLDARDRNGYTALHFAALAASAECTRLLLEYGADPEIVDALGKTPQEIAGKEFFTGVIAELDSGDDD